MSVTCVWSWYYVTTHRLSTTSVQSTISCQYLDYSLHWLENVILIKKKSSLAAPRVAFWILKRKCRHFDELFGHWLNRNCHFANFWFRQRTEAPRTLMLLLVSGSHVTHLCVSESCQHWFRLWFDSYKRKFSKPSLIHCHLNHSETNFNEIKSKCNDINQRTCI